MATDEVIIIGAGPAGIAAAIQLKRQGITPVVFEKSVIGGLLRNANLVENYPGFPGGISGASLAALFERQLKEHLLEVVHQEVTSLDFEDGTFLVSTGLRTCCARAVLVASGTAPRLFTDVRIPGSAAQRVLNDVCTIIDETDKKVVIVGAGDAAFDYALSLGARNDVVILNRGTAINCLPLLRERAMKLARVGYRQQTRVSGIDGNRKSGLVLRCTDTQGSFTLSADYLVFAIGRYPQLGFLSARLRECLQELRDRGLLHFVGDVNNGAFRQTAISVGQAVMAAMKIYGRLQEAKP